MSKHSELNINRKYQKGGYIFADSPDAPDVRDTPEYQAYEELIVGILENAACPLSIPDIHRRLGDRAKRDWTGLALISAKFVLYMPLYPNDLFSYEPDVEVRAVKDLTAKDANARIFAQNGRARLEAKA
jgi:hypothetical protein